MFGLIIKCYDGFNSFNRFIPVVRFNHNLLSFSWAWILVWRLLERTNMQLLTNKQIISLTTAELTLRLNIVFLKIIPYFVVLWCVLRSVMQLDHKSKWIRKWVENCGKINMEGNELQRVILHKITSKSSVISPLEFIRHTQNQHDLQQRQNDLQFNNADLSMLWQLMCKNLVKT